MRIYHTIYRHGPNIRDQVTKRPDDEEVYDSLTLFKMKRRQRLARWYAEAEAHDAEKYEHRNGFCPKCGMLIPAGLDHCPDCEE